MVAVTYKKCGVKLTHIWFAGSVEEVTTGVHGGGTLGDILFVHGCQFDVPNNWCLISKQNTLVKNLNQTEDELFQSFGKHLRSYIKRSEREGTKIILSDSDDLRNHPATLDICRKLFEKMFADKGIPQTFNLELAEHYIQSGCLLIGIAYYQDVPIGFDAVIYDEKSSRLWLSAFDFRGVERDAQILSRGHQQLDWKIMLHCIAAGILSFDFGGVNSFDEPNGIARFKMEFEKKNKVTYQNYLVPTTFLGKLAIFFYKLKNRR